MIDPINIIRKCLVFLGDSLRAEVAEHNISVLCVSPGYINTALSLNALTASGRAYGSKSSHIMQDLFQLIPMKFNRI